MGRLAQTSQSFLAGAPFFSSTLSASDCVRVAMGLFGLFTHWDKIGPLHSVFVEQYSQPSAGVVALNMNWYAPIPPARDVSRACRTYAVDSYERRCAPTYMKLKTEPCSEKIK